MSEQHQAGNGRLPSMNTGQWIQPEPPRTPRKRMGWVTLVSVLAGLLAMFAIVAACSSFAQGVKDGYQSSTATTAAAVATTTLRPTTPPPTTTAVVVTTGARVGAAVGLAPTTTEAPTYVPDDGPLSAPDPEAEVNVDAPPVSVHYSSCKQAKAAGAAPLHRGEPGYRSGLDRDGDGTACET